MCACKRSLYLDRESRWLLSSPLQVGWRPPRHPPRCWWCWGVSGECSSMCTGRCSGHPGSQSGDLHPGPTGSHQGSHTPERMTRHAEDWEKHRDGQIQNNKNIPYVQFKGIILILLLRPLCQIQSIYFSEPNRHLGIVLAKLNLIWLKLSLGLFNILFHLEI